MKLKDTPEFTLQLSNSQESQSSVESKQLRFPWGNADLLNNYSEFLTEYEQKEVLEYPIIYYLNLFERRREGVPKQNGNFNNGWSKENG